MYSSSKKSLKLQNFPLLPLSIAVGISMVATLASAAENTEIAQADVLPTITIETQGNWLENANEKKVQKHAGARTIIDRKRLNESAATSLKDALRQVPGVQAQENNGTGGSDVSLNIGVRGLTSRLSPRSTVLIDGIPMSFAPYGQPQLSMAPVSLGNIESVDVVRGAGSVRFGPQNVGGIINFATRSIPEDFKGTVALNSEYATGTDQVKLSPSLFVGGTLDNGLGLALLYSGTKGNSYREANNKNDIDDVMLKTAYDITDQDKIALNFHHYDGTGEMPEGLSAAEFEVNPYQTSHYRDFFTGRRSDVSLRYTHKDDTNNFELLSYYIDSFRTSNLESTLANGNHRLDTSPRDYKVFAIEPRYSRSYSLGSTLNEVTVGYRYMDEESTEFAGRTEYAADAEPGQFIARTRSAGGTKAHAAYIDNRIELGKWNITPGVRFESIDTQNSFSAYKNGVLQNTVHPSIQSDEFLPSLAVLYKATDHWNFFANAGVSFGPQQYNQLATTQGTTAVTTLDGLHPEKSNNYEIGTKYLGNGLSAELTAFYLDFDKELILERDAANNGIWTDLGATSHKGIETGFSYDFGHLADNLEGLKAYGNYTYTKAVAEAGNFKGKDLPFYSQNVANFGLGYKYDAWSINADMYAQSKQRAPGNQDSGIYQTEETANGKLGDIPGYSTFAVRTGYDFGGSLQGVKVAAGIKNVFDKQYFTRSSDATGGKYIGQPRTFFLQTSFDF
ncbi:TonB-dependent siderophore receptor [Acinetobacter sp. ANC 4945]|uniref:TonB-dependent siderophore receptor n=2 Tax=Acinetobacter amyesii TaxID=2942470 RepID=A0A1T1GY81_9GAMM|nr:TonB-dependent siderophore receptor [Acinetobacter amyesii]MCL6246595.1 TonB-dependent siderophore receptor [Acinetobacter amyesii]OOV82551.1 TonB-dependent siderophore receptor [Acinetobacter amyesii]